MDCPRCATPNPDGAQSCSNCGKGLELPCSNCGVLVVSGAKFCQNCAYPVSGEVDQPRFEPYLPKELQSKLEAARAGRAMEGERRIVTMLFCDVKGSTAIAENLDPEEWTEIMNGAFEHLIAPVYRYEGTLARLMGDAVFALFGAPIAHEDDPQRAVMAGMEIVDGIRAYREKVRAERDLDLSVRVGINTGQVMVGQVGSDLRLEYTAMGDAVNIAARMEQTADPGTVQITGDTLRLVAPFFDVESRGTIEVKGKREPILAYRVVGARSHSSSVRSFRIGGRGTPLVGRRSEMAVLRRAVAEALDGRGQIVSLIGEAGLGKSRLVDETQAVWARHEPADTRARWDVRRIWEVWQCVSYDTSRPYAQYRRMLAKLAGISDTDPPNVVRQKLVRTIDFAQEWVEPHMKVWRPLFGVQEPGEETLDGEAFQHAITELVAGSTRHAGSHPRLLVFEDLHWCDEASMDLLIETAKLVDELPCLFLFTFRPDRQAPSWRLRQWLEAEHQHRSAEIVLTPLTDQDSGALVDELLSRGARSGDLRAQILERTEGNPLFVEELAAAVLEQEAVEWATSRVAVPTTLQALISARLDRLGEETRRTLQLASIIGRTFSEEVLRAVAGEGVDLVRELGTLQGVGLIEETAQTPRREYSFHHTLTQEATYNTILLKRRRELHLRVAEVMEDLYTDRMEEFAPLLARHFHEAGDDERTLTYATLAGDSAARLYANSEAVSHYTGAIEAADRLGLGDVARRRLHQKRDQARQLQEA